MAGRIDRLGPHLAPGTRLVWGALLLPVLVFQPHWQAQLALTLLFGVLAVGAGKRVSFGYFSFLAASITAFNLITPFGKVLWQVGPWALTEGALFDGLAKGISLVGLVFVSLFSVSRHLRLPGKFGGLLARTFLYYEMLLSHRKSLKLRSLVISIDRLLERLYDPAHPLPEPEPAPKIGTTALGWLVMGLTLSAGLALLFWR